MKMKRILCLLLVSLFLLSSCGKKEEAPIEENNEIIEEHEEEVIDVPEYENHSTTGNDEAPVIYFTSDISSQGSL